MLNSLISWSIQNRFIVLVLAAVLIFFGVHMSSKADIDVLPEFAPPQVVVETQAPGMVPEQVEALVSIPLESILNGMPGVDDVRSLSLPGVSVITVIFDYGSDIYRARQVVSERLQMATSRLPDTVKAPTMLPLMPAIGDVLKVGLLSEKTPLMDLRTLADWEIKNRLLAVPGVARVLIIGGETREYQVLVSPEKLKAYNVSLSEVVKAVKQANSIAPGGYLVTPDQTISILGSARVKKLSDLADSVVVVRDGTPVLLRHLARVSVAPAFKVGDTVINGQPGVYIYVTKLPGVDGLKLDRRLQAALKELKDALPPDVQIVQVFNQANFIKRSINNVLEALGLGAFLVVLVLAVFLLNWRTSIISLVAIPLSIITALLVLKFTGGTVNTMTLGGLAIAVGEVVDDAIIDVENVYRRLRENKLSDSPRPAYMVVYDACVEVRSAVVYATFIVVVVFVPVFTLPGVTGHIFAPLGFSYVTAILASLLTALTVTPALCMYFLCRDGSLPLPESEPITVTKIKGLYERTLGQVLWRPGLVVFLAFSLFVSTAFLLPTMGEDFLPQFREDSLIVTVIARAGQSLEATTRMGGSFERTMLGRKDVTAVAQWAGRAETDDMAGGPNFSEFDIQLKPSDESLNEILKDVRYHLNEIPGIVFDVGSFISHRMDEVLSGGTKANIVIKIFGPDLAVLRSLASETEAAAKTVRGAVDVRTEPQVMVDRVSITMDRLNASRYGISSQQFMDSIETIFQGKVVSRVLEGQRLFDLKVWIDAPFRHNLDLIKSTLIDTPSGGRIPLSTVASVRLVEGPSVIVRENVTRRIVVQANTEGRDVVSTVNDIKARIAEKVKLPRGYYIAFAGQYAAQQESSRNLLLIACLTLIAIFILLRQALGSWKLTVLVASNLPLAFIGGIIAVALTGNVLTLGSLIGFISLFGISTRNSILMISHMNALMSSGLSLEETIMRGALDRVAPVLMTALTASFGMLPLAVMGGAGRELEQPLAIVIVGGMASSTLLTLVVVPALYKLFMSRAMPMSASRTEVRSRGSMHP
ncbi:MAG: efflux RND transporter permease subunit [Candidatus Obscuribacterales bacterium]